MEVALAHWLPPSVAAALLMILGGFALRLLTARSKELFDDVKVIKTELTAIDKKLGGFATIEALGNMGNRFDARNEKNIERMVNAERDIAVLKADVSTLLALNERRQNTRRKSDRA